MLMTSKSSKHEHEYLKTVKPNLVTYYVYTCIAIKKLNQNYIKIDLFYPKSLRKHIAMNNNLKCFIVRV